MGKAVVQKLNHVTSIQTGTVPRAQVPFRVRAKKTFVSICYYLWKFDLVSLLCSARLTYPFLSSSNQINKLLSTRTRSSLTPFILSSTDSSLISSVKNADRGLPSERTNTQNGGGVRLTTHLTVVSYNRFLIFFLVFCPVLCLTCSRSLYMNPWRCSRLRRRLPLSFHAYS